MTFVRQPATRSLATNYEFKAGRYSSPSVMLAGLPSQGLGRRVLDLGCGAGDISRLLSERGFDVTCVDRPCLDRPRLPETVQFIEADLDCGLPALLAPPFDYIICGDVLEHLKDPGTLLASLAGVLAPGGRLVASLPNSGNLYFRLNILLGRFPSHDRGLFDRTHLHFYMWSGWKALFEAAGLHIETVRPTAVPFSLACPAMKTTAQAAESLYYLLARAWKKLFAYQFVVAARRRQEDP